MTDSGKTASRMKWWHSVRTRLYAAFAVILILALSPSFVSFNNFSRSTEEIDSVITDNVPVIRQSSILATAAGEIMTDMGQMVRAVSDPARIEMMEIISANLSLLSQTIDRLPENISGQSRAELVGLRDKLAANLSELNNISERHLALVQKETKFQAHISQHLDKIAQAISSSKKHAAFDLSLAFVDLASGRLTKKDEIDQLINEDFASFQFSMELEITVTHLRSEIARLANFDFPNGIDELERSFQKRLEDLTRNLRSLAGGEIPPQLRSSIEMINDRGVGENNIFDIHKNLLLIKREADESQKSAAETATHLRDFSSKFATSVVDEAEGIVNQIKDAVSQSNWTIIQLTFLSILGFFLILGFIITPQLVTPITATAEAMRRIASGDPKTDVPNIQIGEIGQMISALGQLREYVTRVVDAERSVAEKEAELRLALDNMPGGIMVIDDDLNIQLFNQRYVELYELPDGLLRIGGSLRDMIQLRAERGDYGPGDPAALVAARLGGYGGGDAQNMENKLPSGRVLETIRNPTTEGFLVAICNDITERRQAEREIAEKEAQLRMAMDNMPGAIWVVDSDLTLILANDQYIDFYGDRDGIVKPGTPMLDIIRQEGETDLLGGTGSIEDIIEKRLASYHSNKDSSFEDKTVDGREIRLVRSPTSDGFVVTVATDITESKKAERAIRENEKNLRDLLDSGPIGIGVVNQETNERMFVNQQLVKLMGAENSKELTSSSLADSYVNTDDLKKIQRINSAGKSVRNMEVKRRRQDGSTFWCLQSSQPLGLFQGKEARVVWMVDVSDLKAAEAELIEQKRLVDTAMSNMSQGISMFDENLNLVAYNDRYIELLEFPPELIKLGTHIDAIFRYNAERGEYGEGDLEELIEERVQFAKRSEPQEFERTLPDGRTIQFKRQQVGSGGFVTTQTDITETLEAQRGAKLLKEALDTFSDMIILYDKDERVIFTNDRYHEIYPNSPSKEEITSYTMEGLLRRSLEAGLIDHPLAQSDPEAWLKDALAKRRNKDGGAGETTHKNGRSYFFRYSWTTEGGMILVQIDITERKTAEQALAEQKEIVETVLQNMDQGILMIDGEGVIVAANDQYTDIIGVASDWRQRFKTFPELVNHYYHDVRQGEDATAKAAAALETLASGKRYASELDIQDGKTVEIRQNPLETGGVVRTFADVTERKKAERVISGAMKLISESLNYASRIQRSLLPPERVMNEVFSDHCMIWDPTDMVGGDMIWLRRVESGTYLIVADCTGHGAPGAFMTMICTGALDQGLAELDEPDPAELLARMNVRIKSTLGQDNEDGESDDGVELGICHIDTKQGQILFAGARFTLSVIEGEDISEIKGDKSAIGYCHVPNDAEFTNQTVEITSGKRFYLWTDGLVDQIGGLKRRGFGKRRLRRIILDYHRMNMIKQKTQILREFEEYQHTEARRDDITFVGFVP